jgi:hypothetical protein
LWTGNYTSIEGLGTANSYNDGVTTELVEADVKAVFTLLFGSWLGDWDSEDDLQRRFWPRTAAVCVCLVGPAALVLQHMALGADQGSARW